MNSVEKWNDAAVDFQKVFQIGMNDYSKKLLSFLLEKKMLQPGCRVIDIGCGVGKYGTYFASMGCDVTLTDISSGMLEMAKANMSRFDTPWATLECDFTEVDPKHPVFEKGFDLAISTMCPAVHDLETVKKLSNMVHGHCFITHFTSWEEPLRKVFFEKLGVAPVQDMNHFANYINGLMQAVKDAGYEPHIHHEPYNWSDTRTPEDAARYLLSRLEDVEITDQLRDKALSIAKELCNQDGTLEDAVNTTVAWIWWETKGA